jgi:hypothetical protein
VKIDFRTERRDLYSPSAADFGVVDVPAFRFAMVNGHGDPNTSPDYARAVEALYSVSYAAKFASKADLDRDYVVGPLEGLWDAERMAAFVDRSKDEWSWTMMIRQPDWLTAELWDQAVAKAAKKREGVDSVRLGTLEEGLAVQILHVGSYDDEAPTIARLHGEFLPQHSYVENGRHHEIYLSDPRRVEAAKLKTVLRQPVRVR